MKNIIVVGGGVGGLVLATRLGKQLGKTGQAKITLVDKNAHHFWKPMLHEVATGSRNAYVDGVDYRTQGKLNHFKFRQGALLKVDRAQQRITAAAVKNKNGEIIFPESQHDYDVLVLAIGSIANDFGTPGVKEHCIFLNDHRQAESFRQRFLETLYQFSAQTDDTPESRVNISIVGAGATGVELGSELFKMVDKLKAYGVAKISPEKLHVRILEASDRILPAIPLALAKSIQQKLVDMGINVMTSTMITKADEKGFYTKDGDLIESDIMVWTAGVKAPDFLKNIEGLEFSRANQLLVKPTLQATHDEHIFAIGDCAACPNKESKFAPATAQAAAQMSKTCLKNIKAYLNNEPLRSFEYKDSGTIITVAHTAQGVVSALGGNKQVVVKGTPAYTMHHLFYYAHQAELYGVFRSIAVGMAGRRLRKVKSSLDLPTSHLNSM